MAYSRPFGQNPQGASPWSAGVPPGLQQQHQHPQAAAQQMFQQPMGAFDISGAWQVAGQQQAGQWAPQMQPMQQPQVQFVPNPAFMPNRIQNMQPPQQQQQLQRPMHQRSLSAPRSGVNGFNNKRGGYQNNSFGGNAGGGNGGQWQNRPQHNSFQQQQQRATRQQVRQNNQKSHNNNNNNTNGSSNNNANTNNNSKQQKQQPQQQQQAQQQNKGQAAKLTRAAKKANLKAKLAGGAVVETQPANEAPKDAKAASPTAATATDDSKQSGDGKAPQSKTAERKQLKLQARKNAEALRLSKLPIAKGSGASSAQANSGSGVGAAEEPLIDQAQLKCVPAVFGFVCKCCEVFLRDRVARREHIDSEEHMKKFELRDSNNVTNKNASDDSSKAEADTYDAGNKDDADADAAKDATVKANEDADIHASLEGAGGDTAAVKSE